MAMCGIATAFPRPACPPDKFAESPRAGARDAKKDQDQAIEIPELSVRNAAKSSERHTRRDFHASGIPCQQGFFAI
jgi:hypothetical protein